MPDIPSQAVLLGLAEQLSAEFCTRTSRTTIAALCTLLPGLKYYSVGVASPNASQCVVSSSSGARAGPSSTSLHTLRSSAIGMVSNTGKGLQANLEGAAGRVMRNFSDIHEMLYQVPTCMYTICLPIKPASPGQGVSGALLLGFSAPPDMSSRRLAALAQLCTLLSQTLEDAAERMVCMVEQMIGAHDGCTCCMPEPAIPESAYDTRCRDDSSSSSGDDQGPQPPLLESIAEHPEEGICPGSPLAADSGLAAEAMATWSETPDRLLSLAEAEVSTSIHEPVKHGNGHPFLGGSSFGSPAPPFRFEKAIVVSVEKEDLVAVSPSGLSYARNDLEKEFTRWLHRRLAPIDALYATLVLMALCVMHSFVPGSGIAPTMRSLPLALPLAVPLVLGTFAKNFYHRHRELLIMGIRAYLVALLACTMAAPFQGSVKVTSMSWWVMSSIEVLLTPAVGLQLRLGKHLPLQGVMMAALCAACAFSGAIASVPQFIVGTAATFGFGFALPAVALRKAEARARSLFAAELSCAACLT